MEIEAGPNVDLVIHAAMVQIPLLNEAKKLGYGAKNYASKHFGYY